MKNVRAAIKARLESNPDTGEIIRVYREGGGFVEKVAREEGITLVKGPTEAMARRFWIKVEEYKRIEAALDCGQDMQRIADDNNVSLKTVMLMDRAKKKQSAVAGLDNAQPDCGRGR